MSHKHTLTTSEVAEVSHRAVRGYDKWHRMWAGIASNLERYEDDVIYLRIENTEHTWPSNQETAAKFARMWRNWNEELKHAQGYVVSFYTSGTTGGSVAGREALISEGLVHEKISELIAENSKTQKLVSIFSGLFTAISDTKDIREGQVIIITCGALPDVDEEQSFAQHHHHHPNPPPTVLIL